MSYLVLARKYRPQRFSELVGQEHVARTLTNAIAQNRVHHAFLFTGRARRRQDQRGPHPGQGAVLREGADRRARAATCDLCQEIAGGRSVDVIEIDARVEHQGRGDASRSCEGVRYLPARARRKVYIIDEVHMLSAHSFNALLKTLEEPPPHVVFMFATTEVHKIPGHDPVALPALRLQADLDGAADRAPDGDPARPRRSPPTPEAVRLIARQAAGSVRDGLSLLDQVIAYVGDRDADAPR